VLAIDVTSPAKGPFPSDRYTVPDPKHNTGLRVNLPKPNCAVRPSDCADIDVINTLDGFNVQPRLTVAFSGPIDLASVDSSSVFVVSLGDALGGGGEVVGINQMVWEPTTNTLYAESDALLDQHTRYALVVTDGVKDTAGDPVGAGAFATFRHDLDFGQTKDPILKTYRKSLLDALQDIGVPESSIVTMSVFSTQSVTAVLEKIRNQIKASTPAAADFLLAGGAHAHGVPVSTMTGVVWNQQRTPGPADARHGTGGHRAQRNPGPGHGQFDGFPRRITRRRQVHPGDRHEDGVPAAATEHAVLQPVPARGTPPDRLARGNLWHGFGDSKNNSPFVVAEDGPTGHRDDRHRCRRSRPGRPAR
jgi:hypothetical protein